MEESDSVSSTQRVVGSDKVEDTEEPPIRALPIVTTLSFVRVVKDKTPGFRASLTYYEYDHCDNPQGTPIHLSRDRTKMLTQAACRSCENDWRRIMANALKLSLKKLQLMSTQLMDAMTKTKVTREILLTEMFKDLLVVLHADSRS